MGAIKGPEPVRIDERTVALCAKQGPVTMQVDRSVIQACMVPAATRPNVANLSWLGTEDLNGDRFTFGAGIPPNQESTYGGTCTPSRRGMNNNDPINIVIFWPHMHQLGTNIEAAHR